jgi:valyl-tRNA synthetase
MELSKSFDPHTIEARWYPEWEARGYFKASELSDKPPYCIQLPPPNVTGTLHIGSRVPANPDGRASLPPHAW